MRHLILFFILFVSCFCFAVPAWDYGFSHVVDSRTNGVGRVSIVYRYKIDFSSINRRRECYSSYVSRLKYDAISRAHKLCSRKFDCTYIDAYEISYGVISFDFKFFKKSYY